MDPNFHFVQAGYNRFLIDKRYSNLKPCGDGSYGFVASADDAVTGTKVAIKKIKDTFSDSVDAKRILRELKLLRHFNSHENIISILDIMTVPPNTPDFTDIYIVTNLMESDLERIIRSRQTLTDQHFQYFLYQILRALKYVHSANVLHRDLKPSNLLVNANCDLAVCDFGLARGFYVEGKDTLTEYVVTRWYRAPELLCEATHYGKPVDIWSIGCIFAELLIHDAFLKGDSPQHQLEIIVSKLGCPSREKLNFVTSPAALQRLLTYASHTPPPFAAYFPRGVNPQALALIRRMLEFHPDDRITVEEALEHPYLADFHGQMPEPHCKSLFDFNFESADARPAQQQEMSSRQVQLLMYEEMLLYRPQARPPGWNLVSALGAVGGRAGGGAESKGGHTHGSTHGGGGDMWGGSKGTPAGGIGDGKHDDDDEGMRTAREGFDEDGGGYAMAVDGDDYGSHSGGEAKHHGYK